MTARHARPAAVRVAARAGGRRCFLLTPAEHVAALAATRGLTGGDGLTVAPAVGVLGAYSVVMICRGMTALLAAA
jgi:hypothetical protein